MIHFSSHYRKNKFCCRFSYAMRGWERERERWGGWRNSIDEFSIFVIIENLSFLCWCSDCNKEEREKSVAWQLMHKYKFDVAWKLSFSSELFFLLSNERIWQWVLFSRIKWNCWATELFRWKNNKPIEVCYEWRSFPGRKLSTSRLRGWSASQRFAAAQSDSQAIKRKANYYVLLT